VFVLRTGPVSNCRRRTAADALRNSLDLARHVEELGFKRFWLAEHHNMTGIASAATVVVIAHVRPGRAGFVSAPAGSCCRIMRRW